MAYLSFPWLLFCTKNQHLLFPHLTFTPIPIIPTTITQLKPLSPMWTMDFYLLHSQNTLCPLHYIASSWHICCWPFSPDRDTPSLDFHVICLFYLSYNSSSPTFSDSLSVYFKYQQPWSSIPSPPHSRCLQIYTFSLGLYSGFQTIYQQPMIHAHFKPSMFKPN